MMGSPPIPTAVEIPSPALATWSAASYVSVPDFETMPILPFLNTNPGRYRQEDGGGNRQKKLMIYEL